MHPRCVRNFFSRFDRDNTGSITREDFVKVLELIGLRLRDHELDLIFEKYEHGAGRIDYGELISCVTPRDYDKATIYHYGKPTTAGPKKRWFEIDDAHYPYSASLRAQSQLYVSLFPSRATHVCEQGRSTRADLFPGVVQ